MIIPEDIANQAFEEFEAKIRELSREEFIEAMQSLAFSATTAANACLEDIETEEAGEQGE